MMFLKINRRNVAKIRFLRQFIADGIIALDACTAHSGFVNCVVIDEKD